MKNILKDVYIKDMRGYSSENTNKYLANKGLKNGEKYAIDKDHYFIPFARKGEVYAELYYRYKEIDLKSYLKRNKLI
jgi:beta-lactam-binding protein with PASTA domain